jgi:hypothetical protein
MTKYVNTPTELKTANHKRVLNLHFPFNSCQICGAFVPNCGVFEVSLCDACKDYYLNECAEEFDL